MPPPELAAICWSAAPTSCTMLPRFCALIVPYCSSVCVFTSNASIFAFGLGIAVYFPGLMFGTPCSPVPYPISVGLMFLYQSFIAPLSIRSWNS